jgi:hypothetical protein
MLAYGGCQCWIFILIPGTMLSQSINVPTYVPALLYLSFTPFVPNCKSFQESWRVKASQVRLNLYDKIIIFMMSVYLFDVTNLYSFLYNSGQT